VFCGTNAFCEMSLQALARFTAVTNKFSQEKQVVSFHHPHAFHE
jgi:hypothetical protein